jgi:signal transduction histidine kinase
MLVADRSCRGVLQGWSDGHGTADGMARSAAARSSAKCRVIRRNGQAPSKRDLKHRRRRDLVAGKLGAWLSTVTSPDDPSVSTSGAESRPSETLPDPELQSAVLSVLRRQAGSLAERWTTQSRAVLLLDWTDHRSADQLTHASCLVDLLLAALTVEGDPSEDPIAEGLRFGAEAFARGVSLHHTMKAFDLLLAMTLFAMESAMDDAEIPVASAAAGIRLTRRVQRHAAFLSLAVTRGFTQAYGEALRERFRHLRHDLRNPLGTIKSVLALLDDETVPLEARASPSFRAMAKRNAQSLEELIADRLSDAAALLPALASQTVSVRSVASSVRRELRGEAQRRGVNILVDQEGPRGQLDASGLELLLRGTLQAALLECETGEQLRVEFGDTTATGQASVLLSCESGRPPISDRSVLDGLMGLAAQIGATITVSDHVFVAIPILVGEPGVEGPEREHRAAREVADLDTGKARHDVRGTRESHHGEAGAL